MSREEYLSPVGFAREPRAEIRKWIGRFFLLLLMLALLWIVKNRVIDTEDPLRIDTPPVETRLPGPV